MNIKFEYLYTNGAKFIKQVYDLDEIEYIAKDDTDFRAENGFKLIARRQYTGLKDINGVDIYEGDIVAGWAHNPNECHVVKFLAGKYNCGFMAESVSGKGVIHVWFDGLKVIGNIHENPNLV